jgi:predicted aminopeptidase
MLPECRILLASLALALLPGCYVYQAARGEARVLHERRPIPKVIADPATPAPLRATLTDVSAARDFASRELALPDNRSYRTYADIGRPFVVWNVVATPEFSVSPKHWCFPVAGCVAYRGYFSRQKAKDFAAALSVHGFDVVLGGVPAYSTLGRFADPVLSTMLPYGETELAGTIFHELAHQLIYVAGDSAFNEAFATTVEQEGLRRWLARCDCALELKRYQAESAHEQQYLQLFRSRRAELQRLYSSGLPPAEMRERKRAVFAALASDMHTLEKAQGVPSPYGVWLDKGMNNAHLASLATYYDCVPGFERMLADAGGDLPRFYAAVRELARLPMAERDARVCKAPEAGATASSVPSQRSPAVSR